MKKVLLIISIAGSLASCNNYGGDDDDYGWKGEPKDTTKAVKHDDRIAKRD